MYGLLAICLALSPLAIDENVQQVLREKISDKVLALSHGYDFYLTNFLIDLKKIEIY
jgi:hypothetical protein